MTGTRLRSLLELGLRALGVGGVDDGVIRVFDSLIRPTCSSSIPG